MLLPCHLIHFVVVAAVNHSCFSCWGRQLLSIDETVSMLNRKIQFHFHSQLDQTEKRELPIRCHPIRIQLAVTTVTHCSVFADMGSRIYNTKWKNDWKFLKSGSNKLFFSLIFLGTKKISNLITGVHKSGG